MAKIKVIYYRGDTLPLKVRVNNSNLYNFCKSFIISKLDNIYNLDYSKVKLLDVVK